MWTTPGAILTIEFADDETIAGVAVSDSHVLHSDKRKNFLILKPEGCLVPEPIVVLTNLPNGQLRRYTMQIETRPQVCGEQKPVITASATTGGPPPGNLRYVSQDVLGPAADVDYSVVYRHPGDEAEERRAAARAAAERWKKERANRILQASTTFDTKDPYSGDRNLRYMWRGDAGMMPRRVWDNGYSTAFVFPGQQRVPSLYYVAPDGKESTATYSVHGDTIIASGTAREWRLRVRQHCHRGVGPRLQSGRIDARNRNRVTACSARAKGGWRMTINPGVDPVVRQRLRLSRRQKVGIFGVSTALVLGGLMVVHLFSGSPKQEDTRQQFAGTAGMPFSAPAPPAPAPKQVSFTPAPSPAAQPPILPAAASPATPSDDKGLTSAIFADAGVNGPQAGSKVQPGSRGSGGAKDDLSAALVHSDLGATAHATILKHPSLTIPAGTVIPCILQTAINSQLAGFVDCTLPAEVRGATGAVTLLDRGTQVFGEIKSGLRQGQNRLFILWIRARTPENVVVTFDSPTADELGRAGVSGYVNDHFWSRFGAALLYSLLDYGPQLATAAIQNGNGNSYVTFLSPQQQLANIILQDQLNIPPNLEKNQGDTVSIFVARDVDFSGVYDLEATAP